MTKLWSVYNWHMHVDKTAQNKGERMDERDDTLAILNCVQKAATNLRIYKHGLYDTMQKEYTGHNKL